MDDEDTVGSGGDKRGLKQERSMGGPASVSAHLLSRGYGGNSLGVPNLARKPPLCCWTGDAVVTHYCLMRHKVVLQDKTGQG